MTYTESIGFLYGLQKFGLKFGLRGIRALLSSLDHPERQFLSIHIAGTNGKGSTASMIAAIFTAAGYKTGLYTSPHLIHFNERIRINGKPIASRTVARLISNIRPEVEKNKCTFFEAATAIAFKYFAESGLDIAVIETGLGGRLDATNVLQPLVSVITTVGLEHTQILGISIDRIAFEKGGIIKNGIPCITGVKSKKALSVLRTICIQKKSQLIQIRPEEVRIRKFSLNGCVVDLRINGGYLKNVAVSLAGDHQAMNALLAVNAVNVAAQRRNFTINEEVIRNGLKNVKAYSGLEARLSIIQRNPLVLADVAHNPEAVRALCTSIRHLRIRNVNVVIGLMQDKNSAQIVLTLCHIAHKVFVVEARTERSRDPDELAREFRRIGVPVDEFHNVISGFVSALYQNDNKPILVTGSHFVVGEVLAFLKGEKYLTISQ